ncbi:MAG: aminoacyl-tRNA hydrolase [Clostridiales Family XIII bacterium]|jgi:PTH1 family peptidyl-tRNA hydrolase|nr:aminoacyl-tRNA hydrolase [Clostridiales Family XIII bacterium]
MYLIAGLGNPGRQYEYTKHNIGFLTLDLLAEKNGIKVGKLKNKALIGDGFIADKKVLLVKPQTFMNLSGESIAPLSAYFAVPPEDLIVVYDDVDIPLGTLRIRKSGSAGTHNGMKSIIYSLNSDQFPRVRIGIGGDRGEVPLASYVLSGFDSAQKEPIESAVSRAVSAIETIVTEGLDAAMLQFNGV